MNKVTHDGQRWSNAKADQIILVEHDWGWSVLFDQEAKSIRAVLDHDLNPTIEHFGSTAIPEIAAKPIIDIMIILPLTATWERLISPLESLNYVYWAENPHPERMFFVKGMPPYGHGRTHHVHVRQPADAKRELLFRDYLKAHPGAAKRYEMLKRSLAATYSTDREAYTKGKEEFIQEITAKIHAEQL